MSKKDSNIVVKKGEIIPCDGTVIEGWALVDESAVAGVSTPALIDETAGRNSVIKGGLIVDGELKIRPEEPKQFA
jgi:K+-transporting ATPase ATPase B chain